MALKGTIFVTAILVLSSWQYLGAEDFVNPTDLLRFDPVNVRMEDRAKEEVEKATSIKQEKKMNPKDDSLKRPPLRSEGDIEKNLKDCPKVQDEALKSIFKRYLMSLVQHMENRIIASPRVPVEFCLKMRASLSDMKLLKLYGSGKTADVHRVHEKLDEMILCTTDLPNESTIYWLENLLGLSTHTLLQVIVVLVLVIIIAKMLTRVRITRSFITKGIVFAFLISSASTFVELYQKKVADQDKIMSESMTERCPHLSQSVFDRFTGYIFSSFTFQDEHCREYYEAVVVNPFFKVSLLEAGAIAITKTLVAPMKIIGHGMKDFIVGLFKDLPTQFQSVLLITLVFVIVILPFLMSGYTLKTFLLTLHPPPPMPQSLPQEKETVPCKNCICDKDKAEKVEGNRSVYLSAPPSAAATTQTSTSDPDLQVNKTTTSVHINSVNVGGSSKDCTHIKNSQVQKNLIISHATNGSELSMEVVEKNDNEELMKDYRVCSNSEALVRKGASSDGNMISNSNFFLDQEMKKGDTDTDLLSRGDNIVSTTKDDIDIDSNDMIRES